MSYAPMPDYSQAKQAMLRRQQGRKALPPVEPGALRTLGSLISAYESNQTPQAFRAVVTCFMSGCNGDKKRCNAMGFDYAMLARVMASGHQMNERDRKNVIGTLSGWANEGTGGAPAARVDYEARP